MEEPKIICKYCALKTECKRRANKEAYEQAGWTTRCEMGKPVEVNGRKGKPRGSVMRAVANLKTNYKRGNENDKDKLTNY